MTTANIKPVKDKTGTFMRLVYYLREQEIKFYNTPRDERHPVRKFIFALQRQVDERIKQYFDDNPDEAHYSRKQSKGNRTAIFMRQLKELRELEDQYWKFGQPHTIMFPLRFWIDNHMDAYFMQFPNEAPKQIKESRQ